MAFHDVQFPSDLSYGYMGGPGFRTQVIETDGGVEERSSRWQNARWRFDVGRDFGSSAELSLLQDFFLARAGALHSFRFKDWGDYTSAIDGISEPTHLDQVVAEVDGSTTQFQLFKTYSSGSESYARRITLPVSGTVKIGVAGVDVTTGWTVNLTTGIVTFSSAPAETPTAGFEFDVPCRFGIEADRRLPLRIDAFDLKALMQIPIVEVKDETPYYEGRQPGGSLTVDPMSADLSIARSSGFIVRVDPDASGRSVYLAPPNSNDGSGGPYHRIVNLDGTHSITVRDDGGASITTIGAGSFKDVYLLLDGTTYTWELW